MASDPLDMLLKWLSDATPDDIYAAGIEQLDEIRRKAANWDRLFAFANDPEPTASQRVAVEILDGRGLLNDE